MIALTNRPTTSTGTRGALTSRVLVLGILLAGLLAILIARQWTGTGYLPAPLGLPDPGLLTAAGLPATQFLHEMAGVAVVGLLFVRCVSVPDPGDPAAAHLLGMAARWAWLWVVSTLGWLALTASDLSGVPLVEMPGRGEMLLAVAGTDRMLAEMATLWVALAIALFASRLSGVPASAVALVAASAALLPSALSGHAGHHESPIVAVTALAVHIIASAIWVGGLLSLIVHLRRFPDQLRRALPVFSAAALLCVLAIGLSGVVESVVTLEDWAALTGTNRGRLIVAKAAALGLLAVIGFLHRRRTIGPAGDGRIGPLLRLAAGELLVMGAAIGLAVVLSTTG